MQINDFLVAKYWVCYPKIMQIKSTFIKGASFIFDRFLVLVPLI